MHCLMWSLPNSLIPIIIFELDLRNLSVIFFMSVVHKVYVKLLHFVDHLLLIDRYHIFLQNLLMNLLEVYSAVSIA